MTLAVELDPASSVALHEQLAEKIQAAVLEGRLKAGERLPSTRDLADRLAISRGTVVRAYQTLIQRKLLIPRQGLGNIVALELQMDILPASDTAGWQLSGLLGQPGTSEPYERAGAAGGGQETTNSEAASRYSRFCDRLGWMPEILAPALEDLNLRAPPRRLLPVRRWQELLQSSSQATDSMLRETDEFGDQDLRQVVSDYLVKTRGLKCTANEIAVFVGTQQAADTLARTLIDPGDTVVVENPGYPGARALFLAYGANLAAIPVDEGGLNIELLKALRASPKLLYLTPTGQDPTGVVMPADRQLSLIKWAEQNNSWIVEDGWDTDFWHGRPAVECMQRRAPEQIIYVYSFWKILFPLTTVSFLVAPPSLAPGLRQVIRSTNMPTKGLEYKVLTNLIAEGRLYALISKAQKSYRKLRQQLIYTLTTVLESAIYIYPTSSGTHIRVGFNLSLKDGQIVNAANSNGLKLLSMEAYYATGTLPGQFLIPFTQLDTATLEAQIRSFKEALIQFG